MGSLTENEIEIYREDILVLHRQSIEAHLVKDVDFLVKDVSEGFMSVNNGRISYPTVEELRSSFTGYLSNTEFSSYRDLSEPVIGFSDDGSIAWTAVRVKAEGKTKKGDTSRELDFTCAWITLYRRTEGKKVNGFDSSRHHPSNKCSLNDYLPYPGIILARKF